MINNEAFETALAALRPDTRAKVEAELQKALNDTREEIAKTFDGTVQLKLSVETFHIEHILKLSKRVTREYDEITGAQVQRGSSSYI